MDSNKGCVAIQQVIGSIHCFGTFNTFLLVCIIPLVHPSRAFSFHPCHREAVTISHQALPGISSYVYDQESGLNIVTVTVTPPCIMMEHTTLELFF